MAEIIGVKFKEVGKIYYFDPLDMAFQIDEKVIVETARGVECGTVALPNKEIDDKEITQPLKPVLRKATPNDIKRVEENRRKEAEALKICEKKITEHKLDMKLVEVEYTFDNSKILFYFTAEGRVDFRELVKDLATVFKTRIELRQIGVRDEAKMLGGLGVCGRALCCSSFLGEFLPVSIKMAKEQGLSLSPVKISGTCGRLMCCLKYEQEAYSDLIKNSPPVGSHVKTPVGKGIVTELSLLTGFVKVKLDGSYEAAAPQVFALEQLKTLDDGIFKEVEPKENDDELEEIAMLFEEEPNEKPEKDSSHGNKPKHFNKNNRNNRNNRRKPQPKPEPKPETKPNNKPESKPENKPESKPETKTDAAAKDFSDYKPKEKNRQKKQVKGKQPPKNNKKNNFNKNSKGHQPHYRKPKGEKN